MNRLMNVCLHTAVECIYNYFVVVWCAPPLLYVTNYYASVLISRNTSLACLSVCLSVPYGLLNREQKRRSKTKIGTTVSRVKIPVCQLSPMLRPPNVGNGRTAAYMSALGVGRDHIICLLLTTTRCRSRARNSKR